MTHKCRADGCPRAVSDELLMCRACWSKVPQQLRSKVYKTYVPKNLSVEYFRTARAAIDSIKGE